mgnify:CR=1 FL=1
MKTLQELKSEAIQDPGFKAEYEKLEPEFSLASMLIAARSRAGLTQEQLAQRIGMKQASIARIESGKYNPSLKTLQKYAKATDNELEVKMVPK